MPEAITNLFRFKEFLATLYSADCRLCAVCCSNHSRLLDGAKRLEDLCNVSVNPNFRKDLLDNAILPDDECSALDTHANFAIQGLFSINAVVRRHFLLGVSQERHIQLVFISELCLPFHAVHAGPYCYCPPLFNLSLRIAKLRCLTRSTGCISFGIEK